MLFLVALLPALAALGIPLAVRLAGGADRRLLLAVAMAGLGLTLLLTLLAAADGWTGTIVWAGPLRLTAALTPIAGTMAMLVPMIALPILAYAPSTKTRSVSGGSLRSCSYLLPVWSFW